jgi:hypothetical protein
MTRVPSLALATALAVVLAACDPGGGPPTPSDIAGTIDDVTPGTPQPDPVAPTPPPTDPGTPTDPDPAPTPTPVPTPEPDPVPPPPAPTPVPTPVVTVTISPQSATLSAGGTQQFTVAVGGTSNTSVSWSIQEGSSAGAVSSTGLYTASSAPGTYRIVARSQVDPTKYAVAQVTIAAPPAAGYVTGFQPDRGPSAIIDLGNGWYRSNHETFRAYVRRHSLAGDLEFIWRGKTPNDSGLGTQDVTIRIGPNDMNELSIGLWFNDRKLVVQQKYNPEDLGNSWWQAPSGGQWSKGYTYLGGTPVTIQQGQQYTFGYRVVGNRLSVLLDGNTIWSGTIPPESMQHMLGTSTNVRTDNAVVDFRLWLP